MKKWLDKKFKVAFLNILGLFTSIEEINRKRKENLAFQEGWLGMEPSEENLEFLKHLELEYEILMKDHKTFLRKYEWEMKKMWLYERLSTLLGGSDG